MSEAQPSPFAVEIDSMIEDLDISLMDAILLWVEKRKLEPEVAADLVKRDPVLKDRIFEEARELSLVKGGRSPRLVF
jgi:hypothetical protein